MKTQEELFPLEGVNAARRVVRTMTHRLSMLLAESQVYTLEPSPPVLLVDMGVRVQKAFFDLRAALIHFATVLDEYELDPAVPVTPDAKSAAYADGRFVPPDNGG